MNIFYHIFLKDKSSGSENKTSSANIKESSMMDSSRRSEIYSESEEESVSLFILYK